MSAVSSSLNHNDILEEKDGGLIVLSAVACSAMWRDLNSVLEETIMPCWFTWRSHDQGDLSWIFVNSKEKYLAFLWY